jgi:ABC-type multidrug transport system fused ATPase/permease subunit
MLWLVDDFTRCSRHEILETKIPIYLLGFSGCFILYYILKHNVFNSNKESLKLELSKDSLFNEPPAGNYGSVVIENTDEIDDVNNSDSILDKHFNMKYFKLNSGNDKKITTSVVFRSHFERTMLALQELIYLFQVALAITPFIIPELSKEWDNRYTPLINLIFWTYLLLLTTVRLFHSSTGLSMKYPNLWYHSFNLIFAYLFNSFFLFRSALLHHTLNPSSEKFYIIQFIMVILLFTIQGYDHFTDRPMTIYLTEGLTPSCEPQSSFFSVISFSWVNPMITRAQTILPTMNDIWSLKLEDNAFPSLLKFHRIKWHKRFAVNLFYQFRKLFFYQSVLTSFEAILLFFPSMLLKKILEYVESPESQSTSLAWLFVILMIFSAPISSALSGRGLFLGRRICTRMRAIIIGEVYSKALRRQITSFSKKEESVDDDDDEANGEHTTSNSIQETSVTNKKGEDEMETRDLGSIINLIAVDAFKVSEICGYLHYFVNSLVMTIVAISILYNLLGWAALAGAFTIILMMPLNYKLSMLLGSYQKEMLKVTDKRIQKLNEVFQNIRIIKYFAWESKFAEQILKVREQELDILFQRCFVWVLASFVWFITPTTVCLVAFYCYTIFENKPLTTPIAFTSLSLFNLLRTPLDQFADMLSFVVQSKVSLDRIEKFLDEPESTKYEQLIFPRDENSPAVGFQNATFSWSVNSSTDFKLRDLNISFKKNQLNIVIGPTGSGKTSLLLALLGEMTLVDGKVFLPGSTPRDDLIVNSRTGLTESVAYCSQTAWLLNGTIRENILFSKPFDEKRYKEAIEACGLKRDFEILAAGDQTEIGEKGITLSGGQKQRVSLARALYSNSAYVLLDDCLSAVDSHTAVHIYENCITGPLMANRTCILVSHNISLTIKNAGYVVIMDNGRVKKQGSVDELMKENAFDEEVTASVIQSRTASSSNLTEMNNIDLPTNHAHLLNSTVAALTSDICADQIDSEPVEDFAKIDVSGKLINEETKSEGSVSLDVYKTYINLFGSKTLWFMLSFVFIASQLTNIYQSYWLRIWSLAENERNGTSISTQIVNMPLKVYAKSDFAWNNILNMLNSIEWNKPILRTRFNDFDVSELSTLHSTIYYLAMYSLIGLIYSLFGSLRVILFYFGGLRVSRILFKQLLDAAMRAEVRFFDSTPIGRIMNRFSKDIEGIDQELAPYAEALVICMLSTLATIILITWITPLFLIFGIFVSICFVYIGVLYLKLSRELKRFESVTRSPINQHFTETLAGVTTIRAYGDERRFMVQNMQKIDENNRPFFFVWVNNRWMSFRAQVIGSLIVAMSSALSVLSAKHIDAGLAGISLSFAASFSTNALWLLRCYADVEININAVERVQEYIDDIKPESAVESENDPPASWPEHGEISVEGLALKYAPNLPLVIKDISFNVKPGEKVGVVGRTGAGKSTIITSFFRFIEPEQGKITIDGIDISKIGLNALRKGLAIIPQEPTLFTGTLRNNLDMFQESKDIDIYESLKRVGLISKDEFNNLKILIESGQPLDTLTKQTDEEENVNKFTNLETDISESGGNLSQGERQLICLARSLLKHPKILLLDEATASIDYETDAMIQSTIREEFSSSTILTIAHRLKTIIDYDKILVLDHGKVKEYDHPYKLITKPESQFKSMCQDTGEFEDLVRLAKDAYETKH